MAEKRNRGLGSGLEDILGISYGSEDSSDRTVFSVRLSRIEPNRAQPRKSFGEEALNALAESIRQNGVITPVALRKTGEDRYTIIAGERRWRAAKLAGLTEIPAVVLDADEEKAAVMALAENLQREDLNPVEEAEGIRALVVNFSLTQEECAERVGRSRPAVTNALRLLTLEEEILDLLRKGSLSGGHGRALLSLAPGKARVTLAQNAAAGEWSVRRLEEEAKRLARGKEPPEKEGYDYAAELSETLTRRFGRGVRVVPGRKKGRLELEYYGNEDLDALLEKLAPLEKA